MTKKTRVTIKVQGFRCLKCGHIWAPRKQAYPKRCPGCKAPHWDRPLIHPMKRPKKFGKRKRLKTDTT